MAEDAKGVESRRAALLLLAGGGLFAVLKPAQGQGPALTRGRLEQLVAPIALYPDRLLAQVLMAATYPVEVVQAERWLSDPRQASLSGPELERAAAAAPWDPAVKSLVAFPDVLRMMSQNLDWTQALGEAFLEREADLLNAVQVLRHRARQRGHLRGDERLAISVEPFAAPPPAQPWIIEPPPEVIVIEPAQPDHVYVPVYDPRLVYGEWPYPDYPPPYAPPPASYGLSGALGTGLAFLAGGAVLGALWGWARPSWGRGVLIEPARYALIPGARPLPPGGYWRPDPGRRGPRGYGPARWDGRFRGWEAPRLVGGPPPGRGPDRGRGGGPPPRAEHFRGGPGREFGPRPDRGPGPRPSAPQRGPSHDRGPPGGGHGGGGRPAGHPGGGGGRGGNPSGNQGPRGGGGNHGGGGRSPGGGGHGGGHGGGNHGGGGGGGNRGGGGGGHGGGGGRGGGGGGHGGGGGGGGRGGGGGGGGRGR
ncbi:DUF3300 domain-containing protein [Sabulicella rubraurantiaca]|uniref:DUF3300 domain-containing protein n=1 Tax=Sabulicella rubraurantiaca TaxID=2811429 RepID=UPI001A96C1FE|nr:DUF3300 domain-containing protein [Sabulicella rubraurantiaca]